MLDQGKIRQELIAEMAVLLGRSERIEDHWQNEEPPSDWEELAVHRENDEVISSLGELAQEKLRAIRQTLQRMDAGEWQNCMECGGKIPDSRLQAMPTTALCVGCAEKLETRS
jgi:RNA polymerase-binding transcription factor DksA